MIYETPVRPQELPFSDGAGSASPFNREIWWLNVSWAGGKFLSGDLPAGGQRLGSSLPGLREAGEAGRGQARGMCTTSVQRWLPQGPNTAGPAEVEAGQGVGEKVRLRASPPRQAAYDAGDGNTLRRAQGSLSILSSCRLGRCAPSSSLGIPDPSPGLGWMSSSPAGPVLLMARTPPCPRPAWHCSKERERPPVYKRPSQTLRSPPCQEDQDVRKVLSCRRVKSEAER